MQNKNNIVIKKIADSFWVKTGNDILLCKPRGDLKKQGIFVGDYVVLEDVKGENIIGKVNERINKLIRPPLCNLEQLIITIACVPKPDFMIVDKLILFSYVYGIEPIIVVNKIDIDNSICEYVKKVYSGIIKTYFVSAKTNDNIENFRNDLKGKISAFAGQSAVGKSALVNNLLNKNVSEEGELSAKIERGKNTTRHTEIFVCDDIMIADTAGFSSLDETLLPIAYYELNSYMKDYLPYQEQCKYSSCAHYKEKTEDCAVKRAIKEGKLDKDRYNRYTKIYEILKEKWVKTHG